VRTCASPVPPGPRPPRAPQVIAEHFYREGRFELGDTFVSEAGVAGAEAIKAPYVSLHRVLQQVRAGAGAGALVGCWRGRRAVLRSTTRRHSGWLLPGL
jgi:hypothetical protein